MSGGTVTVIMAAVSTDKLHDWRWPIIGLAMLAVAASLVQMVIASHEDTEVTRILKLLAAQHEIPGDMKSATKELNAPIKDYSEPQGWHRRLWPWLRLRKGDDTSIDGEVHRIVTSPRSIAWPLVKDIYKMQGKPDEAAVDTDILLDLYLVNRSAKSKYIRDMRLVAKVGGKDTEFKRQIDLLADDFDGHNFEYGVRSQKNSEVNAIKMIGHFPITLLPEQPVEGWIRFMAKEINADEIENGTLRLAAIDSTGNEFVITKASAPDDKGEIGLRRISG